VFRDEGDDWLPKWGAEAIRIHTIIEMTHWTLDEIESAPAVVLDRLLTVQAAKNRARASMMEK
jgi:hypothetical protein